MSGCVARKMSGRGGKFTSTLDSKRANTQKKKTEQLSSLTSDGGRRRHKPQYRLSPLRMFSAWLRLNPIWPTSVTSDAAFPISALCLTSRRPSTNQRRRRPQRLVLTQCTPSNGRILHLSCRFQFSQFISSN